VPWPEIRLRRPISPEKERWARHQDTPVDTHPLHFLTAGRLSQGRFSL
jgi:hypothetical protein